ncbi:MAG: hypothetical protein IKR41_06470 [Bacteroidales bacterium]|nr:hypothetical protein [Bacteroidales bacterium]
MKRLVSLIALLLMFSVSYGQEYLDIDNRLDTSDKRRLAAAMDLANKVQQMANYIKNLNELREKHQLPLPVGIQSTVGYLLVVSHIEREDNDISKLHLSCVIPLKDSKIGFDGEITVNGNSGLCAPGKIELIEPVSIGKNFKITFKSGTFAEFDCEGIQKFHAEADIQVDSTNLVFYDDNNKISNTIPRFSTSLDFEEIDNFTFSLNKKVKFGFQKLKDWIFTLDGLDFDNSETVTSTKINFPNGYFSNTNSAEKNLWRGVSIGKSQLMLPKNLGKDTSQSITIDCDYFIADNNGFTVSANAQNLGHLLDTTKNFDIDVDNVELKLLKNQIQKITFDGDFNWKALGRFSNHHYDALYNDAENEFGISTNLGDSLTLDFICAELQLDKSSKLNLKLRNGKFVPEIVANGNVTINAGGEKSPLHVPQLDFQDMYLSAEKPYFRPGVWSSEGVLSAKFGNLEIQINDISMRNDSLNFGANIAFADKITAGGKFHILGDYERFKLKKFTVSRFFVDYKSSTFSVYGNVMFEKNDPIYGNYFRGDVKMQLVDMLDVEATALFGRVGNNKYFFADLFADNGGRILFKIPPCFDVYGIGGGAYNRMNQTDNGSAVGKAPSGLYYKPDFNVGFGFLASMKFGIVNKDLCDAKTTFEVQFNRNWGLNYVQFKGDAVFLSGSQKYQNFAESLNKLPEEDEKEENQPKDEPSVKREYPLTASTLMKMDFVNKSFFTYLRAFMDMGVMYGKGANKKLVDATAYFSPKDWYIHLGTPDDRCGIVVDAPVLKLDISSYFMAGNNIPGLPDPPQKVTSLFSSSDLKKYQSRRDMLTVSNGKGVAFGTGFETGISVEPWPFFAKLELGAGGEFLLANYGKLSHCEGSTSPLGIGGWYANAQLWAYLDASIGIQVKFLGKRRKFNIMDAAAAAVLQGAGPNPFYFTGLVGCKYRVLGGLFKGTCSINFEIGEPCKVVEGKELLDQSIIASMTPEDGSDTVNVFVSPQVLLNIDCKNEMPLEIDGVKNIYKVFVDSLKLVNFATKQEVKGSMDISSDGLIISFNPDEALESTTKFVLMAQVSFRQKVGNDWIVAKDSEGTEYVERMESKFTSGKRPDHILPEHLICSYPLDKMYNFYPKETKTGYICLSENYSYLFDNVLEGYEQKLRISTLDGKSQTSDFEHFKSSEVTNEKYELSFDLSKFAFDNQNIYKLEIVNIPKRIAQLNENVSTDYKIENGDSIRNISAEGDFNQLETKQICEINFRTSKYNTLKEKVNSIDLDGKAFVDGTDLYMKNISKGFETDDFFDILEQQVRGKTDKLVYLEADLGNTEWYKKSLYKYVYDNFSEKELARVRSFSFKPADAMTIFNALSINHNTLTDNEIQNGIATGIYPHGMITYNVIFECDEDLRKAKTLISNKKLSRDLSKKEQEILNNDYPQSYTKGDYPYKISYRLPGKGTITSTINKVFKY